MAQLLGSQFCIESLRSDVSDVQTIIMDVFSRAGPTTAPSWKYPDKKADDLDLTELLDIYDYSEDEEERQVAHIVLLELLIDRLIFLFQATSKYVDQMINITSKPGSNTPAPPSTSVGLVVRKYWTKLVQLFTGVQQLRSKSNSSSRQVEELEKSLKEVSLTSLDNTGSKSQSSITNSERSTVSVMSISKDEYNKSTQTLETAFVPCESCFLVQKGLRETGDVLIQFCKNQSLPSSLGRFKSQVDSLDWFSANDVARWTCEQNKDVSRINKYLDNLNATIEPLQQDLAKEQKKCHNLETKLSTVTKDLKLERETSSIQNKNFATKVQKLEQDQKEAIGDVNAKCVSIEDHRKELEKQLDQMKMELAKQQDMVKDLVNVKKKMEEEMEEKIANSEKVKSLETSEAKARSELKTISRQLSSIQQELSKEKAMNQSVNSHQESVQRKQDTLVQRLEELDQENEDLRVQIDDLEEEKQNLESSLELAEEERLKLKRTLKEEKDLISTVVREKEELENLMSDLQEHIKLLEVKVNEAKEHEKLLVEYPDLNGPVNTDMLGSGDVMVDMENQVKANSKRIQILENQNTSLRATISKLVATQNQPKLLPKPMTLWNQEHSINEERSSPLEERDGGGQYSPDSADEAIAALHRPPSGREKTSVSSTREETFIVGKGRVTPSRQTKSAGKSRPLSATKIGLVSGSESSIEAYKKIRKHGLLKEKEKALPKKPPSRTSSRASYVPQDVLMCHKCDKIYNSERDLDIHKSYCFGGI